MPLNPIHIRGKKRTATQMSSVASSSSSKAPASSGATGKGVAQKKATEANISRRVSILERMPVELLVMVYTESQNMDLLYCCRHINKVLNNFYSHVRLVSRAFAPTWSMFHGHRRSNAVDSSQDPPVPAKKFQDIVRFQEMLIHKKSFNIDLILDAQQVWLDEHRPKSRRIHHLKRCNPGGNCDHCKGGLKEHVFNARECFEHDFQLAKASVNKRNVGWKGFRNRQDVQTGVQLQPKMLYGNWDEKYEKLIFWLVAGGAFVDHENWDPQDCYKIVYSHDDLNSFFTYGAADLVNFTHWPLQEAYLFYLSNKPPPGTTDWVPECRMFNRYLAWTFEGDDPRALRHMRREAGRDVNDSDLPYDSDADSGDEW